MIVSDECCDHTAETPSRGITKAIGTKHRNDPVCNVKLLFELQFTRFRNLAAQANPASLKAGLRVSICFDPNRAEICRPPPSGGYQLEQSF